MISNINPVFMNNIINIFIILEPSSFEYDLYFSNSEKYYKINLLIVFTNKMQIPDKIGSAVYKE